MRKLNTAYITGYLLPDPRIPRNQDGTPEAMPELGFGDSLVAIYSEIGEGGWSANVVDVAFLVESVQDMHQIEQNAEKAGGESGLVVYYSVDTRDLCIWIDGYCD